MSEWLRRWTRNPLGSARRGSNPLGVDLLTALISIGDAAARQDAKDGSLVSAYEVLRPTMLCLQGFVSPPCRLAARLVWRWPLASDHGRML